MSSAASGSSHFGMRQQAAMSAFVPSAMSHGAVTQFAVEPVRKREAGPPTAWHSASVTGPPAPAETLLSHVAWPAHRTKWLAEGRAER